MGDYIGEYYSVLKGDTRNVYYSSYHVKSDSYIRNLLVWFGLVPPI